MVETFFTKYKILGSMKEYKVVKASTIVTEEIESTLNRLARQGYKFVAICGSDTIIMERDIPTVREVCKEDNIPLA